MKIVRIGLRSWSVRLTYEEIAELESLCITATREPVYSRDEAVFAQELWEKIVEKLG